MDEALKRELLKILEKDARASEADIAAMLGVGEDDVRKAISELEAKGVIRKYKAVIDWERAGVEKVYAIIDLKVSPERAKGYDAIAERIARFPEVRSVYLVSGDYDLQVVVSGDSMKEIAHFVAAKIAPLEQVKETNTHFLLKTYKEDNELFYEPEKDKRLTISL
ncbi:MAG: DNA-binding transcriptional regulator [Candidatus Alkanophagales archaeon MCA70_species_1]|nr:DNA-binding transcriptional regulator [Candidatus Alkanophaga volatiphilum]